MKEYLDVKVRMRDGTGLSTDIRHPEGDGPFPTILWRTPYSNNDPIGLQRFVDAGYAVVAQDCRGRYKSEGNFYPFRETDDGLDTMTWVRAQSWCDGRFGMIGASYCAFTQLAVAGQQPAGLRAITPRVMGRDLFRDLVYEDGVFTLALAPVWGFSMAGLPPQGSPPLDWAELSRHLPMATLDEAAGASIPFYKDWMAHSVHDAYWAEFDSAARYDRFDVPALHMGGWYDMYGAGLLHNYTGMRDRGGANARGRQKLVMGPWGHILGTRVLGQVDFGESAAVDLNVLEMRWLDRWVKNVPNGIENEPPVRIFVMGANVWRDEWEWPPARAREQAFCLDSCGRANTANGDGVLVHESPVSAPADIYVYAPADPVPTRGGAVYGGAGPNDHAAIEQRPDVLVYTGPELRQPLEVTGNVRAILHVASDAPDTDFIARLCDVHPDGRSLIVCDGVVRMRFREGFDREVMMEAGRIYEIEVPMGATAMVFLPGHKLRLEITSSCFPRFARNLNTGESCATGTRMQPATQTIHHTRAHPSRLILPVIR